MYSSYPSPSLTIAKLVMLGHIIDECTIFLVFKKPKLLTVMLREIKKGEKPSKVFIGGIC